MSKQETAQQLRRVANFFQGLVQAADDIEAIGSMEGATAEAVRARDAAVAEREIAIKTRDAARAKIKADAERAAIDAAAALQAATMQAQAQADAIMVRAQADAQKLLDDAARSCEEAMRKTLADAKAVEDGLADARSEHERLVAENTALSNSVKSLTAQHDKVSKALEAVKAKLA